MLIVARVGKCRWSINDNDTVTSNITHQKKSRSLIRKEMDAQYSYLLHNYNSHIHIIQTLPLPFSSKLYLTAKVKMSRRNQTFYRCRFMKSQKPRTQKIKIKPTNWKLRLRNLIDSDKIIFKIHNSILACILSFYLIFFTIFIFIQI